MNSHKSILIDNNIISLESCTNNNNMIIVYLQDFIYPDNVAYPLGGAGSPRFVVVEMHYDNPNLQSGKWQSNVIITI